MIEPKIEPEPKRRSPVCPACRKPLRSASVTIRAGSATVRYNHADATACEREQAAEQLDPARQ